MIYIINGYPQSGKDSVASIFEELHPGIRGRELFFCRVAQRDIFDF